MPHVDVIAEVGVNHDGDIEKAFRLIDVACAAGADIVKFQTFDPEFLAHADAPLAQYQKRQKSALSQRDMLSRLALSREDHFRLKGYCNQNQIKFLSTPFDLDSYQFLKNDLQLDSVKISSGDITFTPLLWAMGHGSRGIILSTGNSTFEEIDRALATLIVGSSQGSLEALFGQEAELLQKPQNREWLRSHVTLLHCVSAYPAPISDLNLRAISSLHDRYGVSVGFSDHSVDVNAGAWAVFAGAEVIEKHITLDCSADGPDHACSADPQQFAEYVSLIRAAQVTMGNGEKAPCDSERENKNIVRRFIFASEDIAEGDRFTMHNLSMLRGAGNAETDYLELMGQVSDRSYERGDRIGG